MTAAGCGLRRTVTYVGTHVGYMSRLITAKPAGCLEEGLEPPTTSLQVAHLHCEHERRRQDGLVDGGPADDGAVEAMEVVWPSGAALRGEVPNHPQLHWLKTVVVNVVGKGAARSRQVRVGKMSDGRGSSAVDVSKGGKMTSKPGLLLCPGMSLGGTRLLPGRRPAYRQHEPDQGSSMERAKASPDTVECPEFHGDRVFCF